MILMIGSQKGGCGKSTIAVSICAQLAQNGHDVMLVDSDRQATSSNWAMDRAETHLPVVHCIQKYENITGTLKDLAARYEYVVVDAAGRDSRELRTGMLAADVLLVPFRPSQPDLDTLPKMSELIVQARDLNPSLVVRAVLTMAPTNPSIREVEEAKGFLENYPELKMTKTFISDRKVYRDMIGEGKGVIEMDNSKAKAEIQLLMKEIFDGQN